MVSIHGLTIFEEYLRYKIIEGIAARLHGVKQEKETYTYVLHIGLIYGSLQCMEYVYHS